MWIFLPTGYYSAVNDKYKPEHVLVRCRLKVHAERLSGFFVEQKPEVVETAGKADYRWRVSITKKQWAEFVAYSALQVDYDNFKNEALRNAKTWVDREYEHTLHSVWGHMLRLQDKVTPPKFEKRFVPTARPTGRGKGIYDEDSGAPKGSFLAKRDDDTDGSLGIPAYVPLSERKGG